MGRIDLEGRGGVVRGSVFLQVFARFAPFFRAIALFQLGYVTSGYGIFSVYRTNGKQIRVVMARGFTEDETFFYQRKMNQLIS